MKIEYRKPSLIENMIEAIETTKRPIDAFVLTQSEFQSVYNHLHKAVNNNVTTYSFRGYSIKVTDE